MMSSANLEAIVAPLLSELTAKYDAGDVVGGLETLGKIKIALLEAGPTMETSRTAIATTTSATTTSTTMTLTTTQMLACQALELGVLLTVMDGDLDAFGRNIAQLKPYYSDGGDSSSWTPRKCHILGLNLMHLLVDNRLAEFHSELELLSEDEASNPLVRFPIELERQLMVGLYDQVLTATVPDPSFQFFVDQLLQTVRDIIADCVEVSYQEMTLTEAVKRMKFNNIQELLDYVQECRDDWMVSEDQSKLLFQPMASHANKAIADIPSMDWIAQSLSYATEMERII